MSFGLRPQLFCMTISYVVCLDGVKLSVDHAGGMAATAVSVWRAAYYESVQGTEVLCGREASVPGMCINAGSQP